MALPLTHTSGMIQWAVPPPPTASIPRSPVVHAGVGSGEEGYSATEPVELELERRFGRVSWVGWDVAQDEMSHLAVPQVLESSWGLVVARASCRQHEAALSYCWLCVVCIFVAMSYLAVVTERNRHE